MVLELFQSCSSWNSSIGKQKSIYLRRLPCIDDCYDLVKRFGPYEKLKKLQGTLLSRGFHRPLEWEIYNNKFSCSFALRQTNRNLATPIRKQVPA